MSAWLKQCALCNSCTLRLLQYWRFDLAVLAKPASPDIILLGERTLVVLSSEGQLRWQKRFDYQPVAMTLYPVSLPCTRPLHIMFCYISLRPLRSAAGFCCCST